MRDSNINKKMYVFFYCIIRIQVLGLNLFKNHKVELDLKTKFGIDSYYNEFNILNSEFEFGSLGFGFHQFDLHIMNTSWWV